MSISSCIGHLRAGVSFPPNVNRRTIVIMTIIILVKNQSERTTQSVRGISQVFARYLFCSPGGKRKMSLSSSFSFSLPFFSPFFLNWAFQLLLVEGCLFVLHFWCSKWPFRAVVRVNSAPQSGHDALVAWPDFSRWCRSRLLKVENWRPLQPWSQHIGLGRLCTTRTAAGPSARW